SSMNAWAQASRFSSVLPKNGGDSTFEHSALMSGKNKGFSDGTVHSRVTGSPVAVPARKKTGCDCWIMQFCPVVSKVALLGTGIEKVHCHHSADHSPYVLPKTISSGGKTPAF